MKHRGGVHEDDVVLIGDGTRLVELSGIEGNGFLAEHVLAGGQRVTQIGDMRVVRRGDIDGVDARIGVEVLNRFIDLLDAILLSKSLSLGQRTVGDARKLAAGKSERLGHLVGDNAAPDHSPTKLGSRKDIIGEWLVLDRSERCFCGCRGVEWSLLGIYHMCLLCHRTSCISDSSIFAQTRASVRVCAYLTAKRSFLSRKRRIYTHIHAIPRTQIRTNANRSLLRDRGLCLELKRQDDPLRLVAHGALQL